MNLTPSEEIDLEPFSIFVKFLSFLAFLMFLGCVTRMKVFFRKKIKISHKFTRGLRIL